MFGMMDISASAMSVQRVRMNVIANNLANVDTYKASENESGEAVPYRRMMVEVQPGNPHLDAPYKGVSVKGIVRDMSDFQYFRDEDHPYAIKSGEKAGLVRKPNVNPMLEMVDMMNATRNYEANITAFEATKNLLNSSLRLIA